MGSKEKEIPIWEKCILTVAEAAEYSGIGINRLYELSSQPDCTFVIFIGRKRGIKRRQLDEFIEKAYSI